MTSEQITAIIAEIKADYQIPPYYDDKVIRRSVEQCEAELTRLNILADFVADKVARGLLKNFVYYNLNHRDEEFEQNYQTAIKSWQLSADSTSTEAGS